MYDVIIVGAGASGSLCASILKLNNKNLNVLILEKNDKLGKKLSITGNGRCNLGNLDMDIGNFNTNSDITRFEKKLCKKENYLDYLKQIGIVVKEDNGRLYPYSNQAISVCKSFERYLEHLNVKIKYNYNVTNVKKENDLFIINDSIKAYNVVIATGGKSYPKTGSTGFGYDVLKGFGHKIEKLYPSLTYLKTDYKYIKDIAGVRFDCLASLSVDGVIEEKEHGQVQFTKDSVSGICIFNLSRNVSKYLDEGKKINVIINLVPEYNDDELKTYINSFNEYKIEDALSGIINNKLASAITKELKLNGKVVRQLTQDQINDVVFKVNNMNLGVICTGSFDASQVTVGGASLDYFTDDLESIKCKGLYAIGEVLDVDGKCGGYNLAWAFTSAIIVADKISKM